MHYDGLGDEAGSARAMDISAFEDLIDRLGDDLSRWPDDQRLAAEALLVDSAEARTLLDEARALREALSAPPVRAPAGLADRIVAAAGKLAKQAAAAPDQDGAASASDTEKPGKVLPALLLALCLLPALSAPELMADPVVAESFAPSR
jgi:hypothetical protein